MISIVGRRSRLLVLVAATNHQQQKLGIRNWALRLSVSELKLEMGIGGPETTLLIPDPWSRLELATRTENRRSSIKKTITHQWLLSTTTNGLRLGPVTSHLSDNGWDWWLVSTSKIVETWRPPWLAVRIGTRDRRLMTTSVNSRT